MHPPVIEAQRRWMDEVFARDPAAVAVIESALIFEVVRDARARGEKDNLLADWRRRIDRVIVVTAPDELKIARYIARVAPNAANRKPEPQATGLRCRGGMPSRPMRAIAWRTRFPTRRKPPRPTMFLIIRAILPRCAPRSRPVAAAQGREQQIAAELVSTIR